MTQEREGLMPAARGRDRPYGAGMQVAALAVIAALAAAVTVTVLHFGPISRTAGLLLLPYVAWLVFASTLNWWAAAHN